MTGSLIQVDFGERTTIANSKIEKQEEHRQRDQHSAQYIGGKIAGAPQARQEIDSRRKQNDVNGQNRQHQTVGQSLQTPVVDADCQIAGALSEVFGRTVQLGDIRLGATAGANSATVSAAHVTSPLMDDNRPKYPNAGSRNKTGQKNTSVSYPCVSLLGKKFKGRRENTTPTAIRESPLVPCLKVPPRASVGLDDLDAAGLRRRERVPRVNRDGRPNTGETGGLGR